MAHEDSPEKIAQMRSWLAQVATEAGLEPAVVETNEEALLDLIAAVAHGPSRPGAPLTAFLIGVAVGRGTDAADLIGRITRLATNSTGE